MEKNWKQYWGNIMMQLCKNDELKLYTLCKNENLTLNLTLEFIEKYNNLPWDISVILIRNFNKERVFFN